MRKKIFLVLLVACSMIAATKGIATTEENNLLKYTVVPVYLTGMPLGGTTIPATCQDTLTKLAGIASARSDVTFVAKGLCSAEGSENYNLALALRRAEVTKSFLVSKGVEPKKIKTVGLGRLSATDRRDVRGVLLEVIYIPKDVREDVSTVEAARLSAEAAVARAETAEAQARAWATEAKSQAGRALTAADRADSAAGRALTAADRADSAAIRSETMADLSELQAGQAKAEADRAKEEREKAEAMIKAAMAAEASIAVAKEEKKDTSPAEVPKPPTTCWLKGGEIELSNQFAMVTYRFQSLQASLSLFKGLNKSEKWWGVGVSLHPTEKWELSGIRVFDKLPQGDKICITDMQINYRLLQKDKLSIFVGGDCGWLKPLEPEYRNGRTVKVTGTRWYPTVQLCWATKENSPTKGGEWKFKVFYVPEWISLNIGEFKRECKNMGIEEVGASISYKF